jgi:hypothetical protein
MLHHLVAATSIRVSGRRAAVLGPPSLESKKDYRRLIVELVVVDKRELIVLRLQRTDAREQQPSPMIRTI